MEAGEILPAAAAFSRACQSLRCLRGTPEKQRDIYPNPRRGRAPAERGAEVFWSHAEILRRRRDDGPPVAARTWLAVTPNETKRNALSSQLIILYNYVN